MQTIFRTVTSMQIHLDFRLFKDIFRKFTLYLDLLQFNPYILGFPNYHFHFRHEALSLEPSSINSNTMREIQECAHKI